MSKWEDISDILTPEGIEKLNVGEILTFDRNSGNREEYKIMRKSKGKVWVKQVRTYTPEEVNEMVAIAEDVASRQAKAGRKKARLQGTNDEY